MPCPHTRKKIPMTRYSLTLLKGLVIRNESNPTKRVHHTRKKIPMTRYSLTLLKGLVMCQILDHLRKETNGAPRSTIRRDIEDDADEHEKKNIIYMIMISNMIDMLNFSPTFSNKLSPQLSL